MTVYSPGCISASLYGAGWVSTAVNWWFTPSSRRLHWLAFTSSGPLLYASIHSLCVSAPGGLYMTSVMTRLPLALAVSMAASIRL